MDNKKIVEELIKISNELKNMAELINEYSSKIEKNRKRIAVRLGEKIIYRDSHAELLRTVIGSFDENRLRAFSVSSTDVGGSQEPVMVVVKKGDKHYSLLSKKLKSHEKRGNGTLWLVSKNKSDTERWCREIAREFGKSFDLVDNPSVKG